MRSNTAVWGQTLLMRSNTAVWGQTLLYEIKHWCLRSKIAVWGQKLLFEIKHYCLRSNMRSNTQGRNHWRVGGQGPLNIYIDPPNFGQLFSWGVSLALLHCNKVDFFKIYLSTIPQIERFEASRPRFGLRPIRTPNFWRVVAPLQALLFVWRIKFLQFTLFSKGDQTNTWTIDYSMLIGCKIVTVTVKASTWSSITRSAIYNQLP